MTIEYEKHKLFPDSILIRNFTGKVGVKEIIDSWDYLLDNKLVSSNTQGVINNLIGCELQMDTTSFKTLLEYLMGKEIFRKIKLAVVCDCPKNIIFPILGEELMGKNQIKAFSTLEGAENWVIV